MTSFVPTVPSSSRDARSGEFAVKYGPSVNSGVTVADRLPLPHASVLVSIVLDAVGGAVFVAVLTEAGGAVWSVELFFGVVVAMLVGVVAAQAVNVIMPSAATMVINIFFFICSLHF